MVSIVKELFEIRNRVDAVLLQIAEARGVAVHELIRAEERRTRKNARERARYAKKRKRADGYKPGAPIEDARQMKLFPEVDK